MFRVLVVFMVPLMLWSGSFKISFEIGFGHHGAIESIGENLYLRINNTKIKLKSLSNLDRLLDTENIKLVEFEDYNFDGYIDLALFNHYGVEDTYRDIYLFDSKTITYTKALEEVANIEVNTQSRVIVSYAHLSLMESQTTYYKIDSQKKLYKFFQEKTLPHTTKVTIFNQDEEEIKSFIKPSHLVVATDKLHFYDKSNDEYKKDYLLQGDRVRVIDIDPFYAKVHYKDPKREYIEYLEAPELQANTLENIFDIKREYQSIIQQHGTLREVKHSIGGVSIEKGEALFHYNQNDDLQRIDLAFKSDQNMTQYNFYLKDNMLIFILKEQIIVSKTALSEGETKVSKLSDRFYFINEKLSRWEETSSEVRSKEDGDYMSTEQELLKLLRELLAI